MPFQRERGTRFRRRTPKKRFIWTGIQLTTSVIATAPNITFFSLVAPLQVSTLADITVERIRGYMTFNNTSGSTVSAAGYIQVVPTDLAEGEVTDAMWSPLSTDIDALQKRPLYWYRTLLSPTLEFGFIERVIVDVRVRRKLAGDQALVAVFNSSLTGIIMDVQWRVLLSVGRR